MSAVATVNDQPIAIDAGFVKSGNEAENRGYLLIRELVCPMQPVAPTEVVVVAAGEGDAADARAIEAARVASDYLQAHCDAVAGDALRQAFQDANTALWQSHHQGEGVSLLVAFLRGKYLSIALAGGHRAYLHRAGRLTPLTKDMRVDRKRSRGKAEITASSNQSTHSNGLLLGETERLNSRTPAIFEITVLPDDELAFVSQGFVDSVSEDRLPSALAANAQQSADGFSGLVERVPAEPVLVAILAAEPARDTRSTDLTTVPEQSNRLVVIVVLVALIAVAMAAAYLLLV